MLAGLSGVVLLSLLGSCATLSVPPGTPRPYARCLDHDFEISAGAQLFAGFNTELRVDAPALGRGTTIDLEGDLGFNDTTEVQRFDMDLALGDRHRLSLSSFDITRRAHHTLDRDIQIGDKLFQINWDVGAELRTSVYKFAWRWMFWREHDFDLSASLGVHWIGLSAGVESQSFSVSEGVGYDLPLPVVGMQARWAIAEDLRLTLSTEAFYVEIDGITGYLIDSRLNLDWDFWDQVGLGLGFNGFRNSIEATGEWLHGKFTYEYGGLLLYVRVWF